MKLYVDLETLDLIEGPGLPSPVLALRFKRGDSALLEVAFLTGATTHTTIGDPAQLEIQFGIKPRGRYDISYLSHVDDWTMPAPGATSPVYQCLASFNTGELDSALGVGSSTGSELSEITLMGEITWREGTGPHTSSRTFAVIIENDVNRGTEGTPLANKTPEAWTQEFLAEFITPFAGEPVNYVAGTPMAATYEPSTGKTIDLSSVVADVLSPAPQLVLVDPGAPNITARLTEVAATRVVTVRLGTNGSGVLDTDLTGLGALLATSAIMSGVVGAGDGSTICVAATVALTGGVNPIWGTPAVLGRTAITGLGAKWMAMKDDPTTTQDGWVLLPPPAPITSPGFEGTPTAPTAPPGTGTIQIANCTYVKAADDLKAPLASPTFTGVPAAPTAAEGTNTTQLATTAHVVAAIPYATYHLLIQGLGSCTAARVAGTGYFTAYGSALAVSGVANSGPPSLIYLTAADFPTVNGKATKLRIKGEVHCNDVAPHATSITFVMGLHPVTRPATSGGAGLLAFTVGTAVSGSTVTVTTPAADSSTSVLGSDFAIPADGWYVLGCVTNATIATSAFVGLRCELQMRNP